MDDDINHIITKLHAHKETHPNIIKLWSHYLLHNTIKFQKILSECITMLNSINNVNDFSREQISVFIFLYKMGIFHRVSNNHLNIT